MQQTIKYGTDEYGNIWHDTAQIEPVNGTTCYNPETSTLDEPFEPDEGKRLKIENGKWIQVDISKEHIKDLNTGIIRNKTQEERYVTGIDEIPKGYKIVDDKLIVKTPKEQLESNEITQVEYNTIVNAPIKLELAELDVKSIRQLREWLIQQPNLDGILKEKLTLYDKEATAKRSELVK